MLGSICLLFYFRQNNEIIYANCSRQMRGRLNEPIKRTSRGNRPFPWPLRKANEGCGKWKE